MNKRWNDRKTVSVGLVVNYPALGLLRGTAKNISHDGMFIETAATSLCNYSDIEVTMNLPEFSDSPVQIQATIIHSNENGIGIMFRSNDNLHSEEYGGLNVVQRLVSNRSSDYQQAS